MPTPIEWTQETWNPVTGCTKVSEGCKNCYAERMARRLQGRFGYPEIPNHFDVTLHQDKLELPYKWKKPRMIFVCSMGDLFHNDVKFSMQEAVFRVIKNNPRHTFQILTKRPKRMSIYAKAFYHFSDILPNLWLGVTAENQETADERIPILLSIPAAVRFVSVEPMLSHISLGGFDGKTYRPWLDSVAWKVEIDWVICGGETGHGAREMKIEWAESLYEQCQNANVPFFFKKAGDAFNGINGLRVETLIWQREYPKEGDIDLSTHQ